MVDTIHFDELAAIPPGFDFDNDLIRIGRYKIARAFMIPLWVWVPSLYKKYVRKSLTPSQMRRFKRDGRQRSLAIHRAMRS